MDSAFIQSKTCYGPASFRCKPHSPRWGTRSPKLASPHRTPQPSRAPNSADAERARPLVEPGRSSPGGRTAAASRSPWSPPSSILRAPLVPNTLCHALDTSSPQPTQKGGGKLKLPANGPLFLLHAGPPAHFLLVALSWSPLELGSSQCRREEDMGGGRGGPHGPWPTQTPHSRINISQVP